MATKTEPDVDGVYAVLRGWALAKKVKTYSDLSNDYVKSCGTYFEPHGSWDAPLGEINDRLATIGAPALSALVVLKESGEPGGNFWGCAPNVPPRPKSDITRVAAWSKIVKLVHAYAWPTALP